MHKLTRGAAIALAVGIVTAGCASVRSVGSGSSGGGSTASASPSPTTSSVNAGAYHGGIKISYQGFGSFAGVQSVVSAFNKTYSGKYYVTATSVPYVQYAALLSSALSAHNAPDIFSGSFTPSVYYARMGLTLPIAPILTDGGINPATDFPASEWNARMLVNGQHYSAPQAAFGTALFYNKTLFKKAGLNPSQPPTTGAQVIADAQALKKAGVKYPIILGVGKGTQDFLYPSLVYQFGGTMGDPSSCASLFNSAAGAKALAWEKSLIYTYHVAPVGPSTGEDVAQFGNGNEGMAFLPAINQGQFLTSLGQSKFGTAPLPQIGSNRTDFLGQNYIWVFKNADDSAAKLKGIGLFLSAMYKQDSIPLAVQGGVVPSYLPALATAAVRNGPYFAQQNAMVQTGRLNPAIPNWGTVTAVPLYDYVQNALLNRQSVSSALSEAQTKTDQLTSTLPGCSK
jgi:multiple sugar transport system substrate-binding protein